MKSWLLCVLIILSHVLPGVCRSGQVAQKKVAAGDVARAMQEVMQRREYAWRAPRQKTPPRPRGVVMETLRQIVDGVCHGVGRMVKWIGRGLEWIFRKMMPDRHLSSDDSKSSLGLNWLTLSAWVLITLVLSFMVVWAWRLVRRTRLRRKQVPALVAVPEKPDLQKEDVAGDELPVSAWLALAGDYLLQREYKLALRAYYLASLAELGGLGMLHLKKFKSNREYEIELGRRAPGRIRLLRAFQSQGLVFDSVWYGNHRVDEVRVRQFADLHVEVMKHASAHS